MAAEFLVTGVRRTLVDYGVGDECLDMVQFTRCHRLDLFQTDESVRRHRQMVVLGHRAGIGLEIVIITEKGWEEVLEKGRLEDTLYADEDEYLMVDTLAHERRHDAYEPLLETVAKLLPQLLHIRIVVILLQRHHVGDTFDIVGLLVPLGQIVEVIPERIVERHVSGSDHMTDILYIDTSALLTHPLP